MRLEFPGFFDRGLIEDDLLVIMPRPYIRVAVNDGPRRAWVDFLVDTGADVTTIHPSDALTIWGAELRAWDFDADETRRVSHGVGGAAISVVRPVRLTFASTSASGTEVSFAANVEVAKPDRGVGRASGNWDLPSVLGRDVLAHFRLEMTYQPAMRITLSGDF